MNNAKLIKLFDVGSKILSHYKDKDVLFALKDILSILEKQNVVPETKKKKDIDNIKPAYDYSHVIKNIAVTPLEDIEVLLEDNEKFPTIDSLKMFAKDLGIKTQSRASRANIIHSIIKSVERSRIDKTISSRHDQ